MDQFFAAPGSHGRRRRGGRCRRAVRERQRGRAPARHGGRGAPAGRIARPRGGGSGPGARTRPGVNGDARGTCVTPGNARAPGTSARSSRSAGQTPANRVPSFVMIALNRLNNQPIMVNADLIETLESTPDTVVTLTSGNKLIVRDSPEEIQSKIIH